jgi:replicative DNA helicase
MKKLRDETTGGLHVAEYPTKSLSLAKLSTIIDRVKPEIAFVDYASIMRTPYKRDEKRFEITDLHEGLRQIAGDANIPIWTAHQANRPALVTKLIDMEHISEDLNVAAIADVAISVNQTDEERQKGLTRIHILGNRLGPTGDVIEFKVNWGLSKISELSPEAEDLEE